MQPSSSFKGTTPAPPLTLNKETAGVWAAWGRIGNREVAREAAAKGQHIDLAILFIAERSKWEKSTAKEYFMGEVLTWIRELLERQQIFKASHVLKNIRIEPHIEFTKIMISTTDRELREYIGNHLIKIEKMSQQVNNLWHFLNQYLDNPVLVLKHKLHRVSIEALEVQSEEWKSTLATILFLHHNDTRLFQFLKAKPLWEHLLSVRNFELARIWINVRCNPNYELADDDDSRMVELFRKFPITEEMVEVVPPLEISDAIYDEFSKFGIFQVSEKDDFLKILKRMQRSLSITHLYQILSNQQTSVITPDHFLKLLIDYCLENKLYSILSICVANFKTLENTNKYLDLIIDFRDLVMTFDFATLRSNTLKVAKLLSEDISLKNYFCDNPIILLSFVVFSRDVDAFLVITRKSPLSVEGFNLEDGFLYLPQKLYMLSSICDIYDGKIKEYDMTTYDLIGKHLGLAYKEMFAFRFTGESLLPHFNFKPMIQAYGYSKKLNYKFYVSQARPGMAAKHFLISQLDSADVVDKNDLKSTEKKVMTLALINFNAEEITSSCAAFLEMIGVGSMKLRVKLEAARIIYSHGYSKENTIDLLLDSDDNPYVLQNTFENILMEMIDLKESFAGKELVHAFKSCEVIVHYSKLNNLKLPEVFLRHCASNNLWLPFMIFAQMNNYPPDHIKLLIQFFKSPNMLEHLVHSVVHDIQIEDKNILVRERDSRKYFLSKIGVSKSLEIMGQNLTHSIASQSSSEGSEVGSTGSSDVFEIDISNIKATLVQTLIRCQNSTDPPKALLQACQLYRNPLLTIFATAYEPDSIPINWLTWLAVSCDLCHTFTNYEAIAGSAIAVMDLIEQGLVNGYPRTIHESLEIFFPDNPLKTFMEFLMCYVKCEFASSLPKLVEFHRLLTFTRSTGVIRADSADREATYMQNRTWIETTAVRLLAATLSHNCYSLHHQILILEHLISSNVCIYFSIELPSLQNVLNVLKIIYDTDHKIRFDFKAVFEPLDRRQEFLSCINKLLDEHQYEAALKISQLENLPPDLILVREWQNKFRLRNKDTFWTKCDKTLRDHKVTADCVIDFYEDCVEKIEDFHERYVVLKLAHKWATDFDLTCQYELETKMWLAYLYLEEKHQCLDNTETFLYEDLLPLLDRVIRYEGELIKDSIRTFEILLNDALDGCNFWLALKLQKMFDIKSNDIEMLKLCFSLAEGMILPQQLNAEQRLQVSNSGLMRAGHGRRTLLSMRFSGVGSSTHSLETTTASPSVHNEALDSISNDTLLMLKMLSERLQHGVNIGRSAFMTYRISLNIEIPYQTVISTRDYLKILKSALDDDCMNKLDVVHDFISVYKWSKSEIADFICAELVNSVTHYAQELIPYFTMWDLDMDKEFKLILQLLEENCSLLGYKLYTYATVIFKTQMDNHSCSSDTFMAIELLVKAHDCFTSDCNMEGISLILKKSKEIIAYLLNFKNWNLIVRLLTGVGRYTEMNYVFLILIENDNFELLLRKGSAKNDNLKVALLEFLRKYCPDKRDLYKCVALHFAIFSEVAEIWERDAEMYISTMIEIAKLKMQMKGVEITDENYVSFQKSDDTEVCLNKIMENYMHATQFHLQGNRLAKALHSAKQAELVALQISLLKEAEMKSAALCILQLNEIKLHYLLHCLNDHLRFEQALIVMEAYNYNPDWADILHERVLVKMDVLYFESFLHHFPLTETLAYELAKKFSDMEEATERQFDCMKVIVKNTPSIQVKYRIASQLGFNDITESMDLGELIYLKDTVWKQGYKI